MEQNTCKYLGLCGGCQTKDMQIEEKISRFCNNLARKGIEAGEILPPITFPMGIRRRANLKIDYGCNVGFYKRATNDVVMIRKCRMVQDEINRVICNLPVLCKALVKRSDGSAFITKVANGLVVHFENVNFVPLDIPKVKSFAEQLGIIRVSCGADVIFESQTPVVDFGGISVEYPIDTFLQPSKEGEEAIVNTVKKFTGEKKVQKIADLFCGLGVFSFNLYNMAVEVMAVDCNRLATEQINKVSHSRHLNITAKCADLFSKPIKAEKFREFDLIVMDPPRDGAKNQITEIAKSNVARVIYVSCNPITFIDDAKILVNAGYKIDTIQPIDQFSFTHHTELVALISKPVS